MEIRQAAVIGAGTMGQGIAQMIAMTGIPTMIYDVVPDAVEHAMERINDNLEKGIGKNKITVEQREQALAHLRPVTDSGQLEADFLIEAVVENFAVKRELFESLESRNAPEAILASNTSSIPITRLAAGMKYPGRVVGMHFFNPAPVMKLVEVISGVDTREKVMKRTMELARTMGKTPVAVKDSPGFIVNRVARHFYVESLALLEEGVCDVEGIDELIRAAGFKLGPFELMDLIGVDTNFDVTCSMYEAFHYDPKFRPSRIQQQKVDAGHHGRKSGKGFYTYE